MLITRAAKSILYRSSFKNTAKNSVFSTYQQNDKPQSFQRSRENRQYQRQLKPYQKLLFSSPLMNINIEMIMAINELRPKATYIIATKNGQYPKQISNSTFNIVECLNYIQGFKYFYKSLPAMIENMTKVLSEKIEFEKTGIYKPNAIKKCVQIIGNIDSIHGQTIVQLVSTYFIWALQNSITTKNKLMGLINPIKERISQIKQKQSAFLNKQLTEEQKATLKSLQEQLSSQQGQIKKHIYNNRFMKQEDFLCGLHYCLQKGYYSQKILKEFFDIMERDDYHLPDFEYFLKDEEQFFYQKPLSNIFNKNALLHCRMYSNAQYRLKIFNELKKMKLHDSKFLDFLKRPTQSQDNQPSQSTSEESPFIDGQKANTSSSQSSSQEKVEYLTDKLIEESLIPRRAYSSLVESYLSLLERKDTLAFILTEEPSSEGLKQLPTEFFSYLNEPLQKQDLTLSEIKTRYLRVFKEMFDIQKNGTIYAQAPFVECVFEIILKMFDYGDRKQVWDLLKIYERYLLTKSLFDVKSLAPFYVYQKYGYKSNFIASKLFEYVNFKYRLGRQEYTIKQELILLGNEICKLLSLYFKLLEQPTPSLFHLYEMSASSANPKILSKTDDKSTGSTPSNQYPTSQLNLKYQQDFHDAVEIFLNNYNKMISVVYLEKQNSGFIGKGLQLSYEYLKVKYFSTKSYQQNLQVEGRIPEEDIRKIIQQNQENLIPYRATVKNVYQKIFQVSPTNNSRQPSTYNPSLFTFNTIIHTFFLKRHPVINPLDQISVILDIVETAIQLQSLKNVEYFEDVLVIFKSIFQNKKLTDVLTANLAFPEILKKMIRISHVFKGNYKNESNKLFESVLNLAKFNLNNLLHTARINIAREILNPDKSIPSSESFQPYLHALQLCPRIQPNSRIWPTSFYSINRQNVISHIRSSILFTALKENSSLEKIIRDQLAKIKTIKPTDKIKNLKFQLNYLEYPYMANVAINKSNELIVVLVRKQQGEKDYDRVLEQYYDECEEYFRKKGNKVIVAQGEIDIRTALRQLIK